MTWLQKSVTLRWKIPFMFLLELTKKLIIHPFCLRQKNKKNTLAIRAATITSTSVAKKILLSNEPHAVCSIEIAYKPMCVCKMLKGWSLSTTQPRCGRLNQQQLNYVRRPPSRPYMAGDWYDWIDELGLYFVDLSGFMKVMSESC